MTVCDAAIVFAAIFFLGDLTVTDRQTALRSTKIDDRWHGITPVLG